MNEKKSKSEMIFEGQYKLFDQSLSPYYSKEKIKIKEKTKRVFILKGLISSVMKACYFSSDQTTISLSLILHNRVQVLVVLIQTNDNSNNNNIIN